MSDQTQLRYADLIDEALTRIPALAPEWTDHNPSDPGIALLELAAWLTETVLYRSTRIDDGSLRSLLGLIQGVDPGAELVGDALQAEIRKAIKGLRRVYRAVTPHDYAERIRMDWPTSPAALEMGLERRIAQVKVLPRVDLEADDRFAVREAHMSVLVVPDRMCWTFEGTLSIDRPTLFLTQDAAEPLTATIPAGGRVVATGPVNDTVLYDGVFEPGEVGHFAPPNTELGTTGEVRITLDQANAVAGLTAQGGAVANRRLTASDGTLLGCRYVPIRREGQIEVVVTSTSDVPLKLELRAVNNRVLKTVEGVGVVALRTQAISGGAVKTPRADLQCRLFAPESEPGTTVDVSWHVQRAEKPRVFADGGDRLLDAVWDFLEPRRLLGTRHHVVGVQWVPITVSADIYLTDDVDEELARPRLVRALIDYFAPPGHHAGHGHHTGRPIGASVTFTEVIACLEGVVGVDYVENLGLTPASQLMTDDGEAYGVRLDPDQVPVIRIADCTLNLFERS